MVEMRYSQEHGITKREYNQSCMKLANIPVFHKWLKHIRENYHSVREKIEDKSVQL